MRKVFEVFSEKISLICFGTLFLFFVKTSVTTSTNFFLRTPNIHCQIANLLSSSHQSLLLFGVVKEESSSSSYKKREKKKNDERREENAPAVFQIQARAGDQLRVDEEW